MEEARKGNITPEMEEIARRENVDIQMLIRCVADGRIVIPSNVNRKSSPCGIGENLSTKINANVGSSSRMEDIEQEVEKAMAAVEYGADAVMDLSTGPLLAEVRKEILRAVDVRVGTVTIYEAGVGSFASTGSVVDMDEDDMFRAIEKQAREGVDFMTIHSGITLDVIEKVRKSGRIMGIVSRGGAFLAS